VAADVAAIQAALPTNLQGAANAVADVFGPAGIAVLGGLATQMQQRLVTGVDDVLNAVMDAMGSAEQQQGPAQQQQQTQPPAQQRAAGREAGAATAGAAVVGSQHQSGQDGAAAEGTQAGLVNLNKVTYLKGLPIPTAGGTVAMLGVAHLYVFPPECSPAPTALMPAHLLRQFVLPECMSALSWLFKYPEVRQQLRLTYYGLDQLAGHLKEALAPTWSFADTAAGAAAAAGLSAQRATAACMPGSAGFPAVVAWDDGAAGGPYLDWLVKLWRVILQIIASQPEWESSMAAQSSVAAVGQSSRGSGGAGGGGAAAAGMADGIRNAAQRARGLAEALAGDIAQALNGPGPGSSNAAFGNAAAGSAGAAAGGFLDQAAAEALWRPLLDWPLLPLADGRLLKLRYREFAFAVLPEYQQGVRAMANSSDVVDGQVSCSLAALSHTCLGVQ
jgi:hypothetical protein